MSNQPNPLAQLRSTEAALVQQVNHATDLVEAVGCGPLDVAVDRFRVACKGAVERFRSTRELLVNEVAEVLGEMNFFGAELREGLAVEVQPLKLAAPEDGDEGDDLEEEPDLDDTAHGKPSTRDDEYEGRVRLMRAALVADPKLSNRELVRRHGGNNATARQARLMNSVVGGPVGGTELAAAAPQKE
jgi:hypothetical protein